MVVPDAFLGLLWHQVSRIPRLGSLQPGGGNNFRAQRWPSPGQQGGEHIVKLGVHLGAVMLWFMQVQVLAL